METKQSAWHKRFAKIIDWRNDCDVALFAIAYVSLILLFPIYSIVGFNPPIKSTERKIE